ncbi:MAG: hypothetical protein AAGD34_13920 [Pseudomonadota bacterium]
MEHRRLSKTELSGVNARILEETDPVNLKEIVGSVWEAMGYEFFQQSNMNLILEAWVAADTAIIVGADTVQMVAADRPDCVLSWGGNGRAYEIVEVDRLGRKRGDEYQSLKVEDHLPSTSGRLIAARTYCTLRELKPRIEGKIAKWYSPDVGLLAYLNLSDFDRHRSRVIDNILSSARLAREAFPSVLVHWQCEVFRFDETGEFIHRSGTGDPIPLALETTG